jgi:hypothetical protein
MPRSDHPSYNWPNQRHYLQAALKHLAAFTDNMQTFLEMGDEAEAQVLTLDFGTTSTVAESETLHTVMDVLREDANENTSLAKRAKPTVTSRQEFPRQRSVWSFDEIQAIRSALLLGFDYEWIAARLGRTRKAVADKTQRLRQAGEL